MPDDAPPADAPVQVTCDTGAPLQPAEPDDVMQTLAFALRFRGRKRIDTAAEAMARITAEHLVDHLARAGFIVMRKPVDPPGPDRHYSAPGHR